MEEDNAMTLAASDIDPTGIPAAIMLALLILERVVHYVKELRGDKEDDKKYVQLNTRVASVETTLGVTHQMVREVKAVTESTQASLSIAQVEIRDLHKWHDQKDRDGVFVWYVRKSLEDAIIKLAENIEAQTDLLRKIHEDNKDLRRELRDSSHE